VPKVKGTKMTITCFGPAFIGLKMGFPILSSYCRDLIISEALVQDKKVGYGGYLSVIIDEYRF
jgi:hypothetical protein